MVFLVDIYEIWYFLALFCVSCGEISWCFLLFPVERNVAHTSDLSLKKKITKKILPTSPKNENKQKRDSPCRKQIADSLTKY